MSRKAGFFRNRKESRLYRNIIKASTAPSAVGTSTSGTCLTGIRAKIQASIAADAELLSQVTSRLPYKGQKTDISSLTGPELKGTDKILVELAERTNTVEGLDEEDQEFWWKVK